MKLKEGFLLSVLMETMGDLTTLYISVTIKAGHTKCTESLV